MQNKGQSFMPDFMASVVVFSIVLSIFLFSWNSVQSNQQKFSLENQIRQDAYYSATFLISTSGYPQGWNSTNVEIPGFAVKDNVLSLRKIQEFSELSYKEQSRLLQTEEFLLNITYSEKDKTISFGNYSRNVSFSTPITRTVLIQKPLTGDELIYTFTPEPNAENNIYHVNFTIEPGSPTIGNSLDSLDINIDSSSDIFSNTSVKDVIEVGVDRDGDGEIDTSIKSDIDSWSVTDSGSDLKIGFGGSAYTNPEAGDSILLELSDVTNPSKGTYEVRIQTSGDGNWHEGKLGIGEENGISYENHEAELELVFWRG